MTFVPLTVLEKYRDKARDKARVSCVPEPIYYTPPDLAIKFLMRKIADVERLCPVFQSQLVDLAVMLRDEQKKIETIFRDIGVYDHCQSYGCCVSMVPSYHLGSPEIELNAALMVKDAKLGKRVVSVDDGIHSLCQFLDRQDSHCGLLLKPWKCITYRGCVESHVADLERGVSDYFELRGLVEKEVRLLFALENERLFAQLDEIGKSLPVERYFE